MSTYNGLDIIAVTARRLCSRPLWEQIPYIAQAGIRKVMLREKDLTPDEYAPLAEKVCRACEQCGVSLIIHHFTDTARTLGIKNIHLPLPELTEELCEEFDRVGTSIHSAEQLTAARERGADYVTAGHIFPTQSKKNLPPKGLAFLSDICRRSPLPVYAIGGIDIDKLPSIARVGASGACMMSVVMRL
ncbi:MAG: thiamine phosphate synthase [Thermoguttaceae bacterium]|nr:thiamine phosphate synthase [Thermoguttaceae bacterium]